jgi:hypothetical protein
MPYPLTPESARKRVIVELAGGVSMHFIDSLLRGALPHVRINDARNLLLIRA